MGKEKKTIWAIRIPRQRADRTKEWLAAGLILAVFFGVLALVLLFRKAECRLYAPDLPFWQCMAQQKYDGNNAGKP